MVDAFSRLFGKSSKKSTSSSSAPGSGDEDPSGTPSGPAVAVALGLDSSTPPAAYNSALTPGGGYQVNSNPSAVMNTSFPPPMASGAGPGGGGGTPGGSGGSGGGRNDNPPHMLEGVPFQLSSSLSHNDDDDANNLEDIINKVNEMNSFAANLTDYNFRLEKSVVESSTN